MDQVDRLAVERGFERRGGQSRDDDDAGDEARYRPIVGDSRRDVDPGVGGRRDEGQVEPVDGGAREDEAEP